MVVCVCGHAAPVLDCSVMTSSGIPHTHVYISQLRNAISLLADTFGLCYIHGSRWFQIMGELKAAVSYFLIPHRKYPYHLIDSGPTEYLDA